MNDNAGFKYLDSPDLARLISAIVELDYTIYGPVQRDDAIVYEELDSVDKLPRGVRDRQEGGQYRLEQANDDSYFSYVVGPDTWKKYLFPPTETLFRTNRHNGKLSFEPVSLQKTRRAFFGIRSCELHAIAIQDQVFTGGEYVDVAYASRREDLLLVAVNCSRSAATCFCSALDTGPKAKEGYDLALTEIINPGEHYFLLEVGTGRGAEIIEKMDLDDAKQSHIEAATKVSRSAAQQQRTMPVEGLKERLYDNIENEPYWRDVAERCLNCANCTLVCPTCFCSTVEDVTELDGRSSERVRSWDSCFNASHSYIVGGSVRQSGESRYRQWLLHKLATWQDQFDSLGCVGCGRCITWCPVGIDITAEIHRLNEQTKTPPLDLEKGGNHDSK